MTASRRRNFTIGWGSHTLELTGSTRIMGILNATPDSFSDGGRFYELDKAVAQGERMVADGADIIDVGGESTRPFSDPVGEEEEIRRVVPVIERLARQIGVPISVDTTKSGVARRALDAGASIINDVSALRFDADMAAVAAEYGVPLILMHMKGRPGTMQVAPYYEDLLAEMKSFFEAAIARAETGGLSRSRLIIDPGIGFGKSFAHNLFVINHLEQLACLNLPVLVGPSRKAFIRHLLKPAGQEDIRVASPSVESGTQAAVAAAILHGAHIVRVHDVANTVSTVKIIDAIRQAQGY